MAAQATAATYESELARFTACGQQQVFRFWKTLNAEQQAHLVAEAQRVDLDAVARAWAQLSGPQVSAADAAAGVRAFENIVDATTASDAQRAEWRAAGLALAARGQTASILMAGGAGTRLGFAQPKGMYEIQLPSRHSLFESQAHRLLKVRADAAAHAGVAEADVRIPYYVMTSDGTHEETVAFFRAHSYFGLNEADVFFFQQGMLPALDFDGKILLETGHGISWAANGNGGLYEALHASGAFADMERRGVAYVDVFCVDNALVRVACPWMIGFASTRGLQCVNKTVEKVRPNEGVGVMCLRASAAGALSASVIEYSEMPAEMAALRDGADESAKLAFRAANIAIHCFSLDFLRTCCARRNELPFHIARKKIACAEAGDGADAAPVTVTPSKENGVKMEMFVFDVFPFADLDRVFAFQVRRAEEFSPVKNAPAPNAQCTRDTARADVFRLHASWLRAAGADLSGSKEVEGDMAIEISAQVSYAGEGLEAMRGVKVRGPLHLQALQ